MLKFSKVFAIVLVGFFALFSNVGHATSPVRYQYVCNQGMYWVGINPGYGGRLSGNFAFGSDSAYLYPRGYNPEGYPVYAGLGNLASYQVIFNPGYPAVSIYQENTFPVIPLANIFCYQTH